MRRRKTLALPNAGAAWTGATSVAKILKAGDLVTVTAVLAKDGKLVLSLDQDPREQGAVVVIENASGAVRAMVGGYDWTQSKFNRSTQALRQAGSAFKPFVYLTAFEQGYTAADTVFDGPLSIVIDPRQPPYRPNNYDGKFHGIVTFRRALEHSYNVPTVRIGQMVGLSNVIETAHRLGVRQNLQAYPSMPLGAFEVTLLEMTAAYSVFANQGLAFLAVPDRADHRRQRRPARADASGRPGSRDAAERLPAAPDPQGRDAARHRRARPRASS